MLGIRDDSFGSVGFGLSTQGSTIQTNDERSSTDTLKVYNRGVRALYHMQSHTILSAHNVRSKIGTVRGYSASLE